MGNKGKVILLNGVSSSGKSSIAKHIALKMEDYFHLSIDDFDLVIDKMEDRQAEKLIPVPTEVFFHETIKMFSDRGVSLIVDQILHDKETITHLLSVLNGYPVLFVGVYCPIGEIERREKARGDRTIGQGRAQMDFVHCQHETYDVEVDTSETSPEAAAEKIIAEIESGKTVSGWGDFGDRWCKMQK